MGDQIFQKVLENVPSTWESVPYGAELYKTVALAKNSSEYKEIKEIFKAFNNYYQVTKIDRVQHPVAYGRFLLRKEQIEKRNDYVKVERNLVCVKKTQIYAALRYNLDDRRTALYDLTSRLNLSYYYVIVYKSLSYGEFDRDCDFYPEYVIHVSD